MDINPFTFTIRHARVEDRTGRNMGIDKDYCAIYRQGSFLPIMVLAYS